MWFVLLLIIEVIMKKTIIVLLHLFVLAMLLFAVLYSIITSNINQWYCEDAYKYQIKIDQNGELIIIEREE